MPTPALRRVLARDGIFNVRDLGGIETAGGRRIRPGLLVRGDALQRCGPASASGLFEHGVRAVVDLRDSTELKEDGSFDAPDLPRPGITVHHSPVLDPTYRWGGPELPPEEVLARRYGEILESFHHRLADAAMRVVDTVCAPGPDGTRPGVAYHCAVGKDRTGLLTMLLLGSLGVADDVIVEDYARSARATAVQVSWLWTVGHPHGKAGDEDLSVGLWSARAATMEATIGLVHDRFGGPRHYLRDAGVTSDALDALAAAVLDPEQGRSVGAE